MAGASRRSSLKYPARVEAFANDVDDLVARAQIVVGFGSTP